VKYCGFGATHDCSNDEIGAFGRWRGKSLMGLGIGRELLHVVQFSAGVATAGCGSKPTNDTIFRIRGGCRGDSLMYNSNFPHVPFGTFCND
jgi:hypothetical protein